MWRLAVQETLALFFTPKDHLVHYRNRDPDRTVYEPAFLQKGKIKTSFWHNKMWTTANERVHSQDLGCILNLESFQHGMAYHQQLWCRVQHRTDNLGQQTKFSILHWVYEWWGIKKQTDKIHILIPPILMFNFQPQKILEAVVYTRYALLIWPCSSTEEFLWATKGATHDRTLTVIRTTSYLPISLDQTNYYTNPDKSHDCIYVTINSMTVRMERHGTSLNSYYNS